jgi:hypothetical protein
MAAPPPLPPPPFAPALAAALAAQLAAVPPLALIPGIQAQVALIPGIQAQVALIQAQVALIPGIQAQVNGMVLQLNGINVQIAALLAQLQVINPAGLGAAVSATLRAIEVARARNHHDRRGEQLIPVPRMDGTLPPSWPPAAAGGFSRDDLIEGLVAPIDALLVDYALPAHAAGGNVAARRAALARALGTRGL